MQRAQQYFRRLWRSTPMQQARAFEKLEQDAATWQAMSISLPLPLRYVARAVQSYHRAGWRNDGDAWQAWCIKHYGWALTECTFGVMEPNPLPLWDAPSAYTDLAEDCIWRAMNALQDTTVETESEQESPLNSLLRQWNECAETAGRIPRPRDDCNMTIQEAEEGGALTTNEMKPQELSDRAMLGGMKLPA